MGPQLSLETADATKPARAPRGATGWLRLVLFWAPVWLAALVFAQLCLFGLRPARQESARLDREAERMDARVGALLNEEAELRLDERRLEDPVYRERVRRSARHGQPLTLQTARERARAPRADAGAGTSER